MEALIDEESDPNDPFGPTLPPDEIDREAVRDELAKTIVGKPVEYPIDLVKESLREILDKEWTVEAGVDSVSITSKFRVRSAARFGTMFGEDPEPVEFQIQFAPMQADAVYRRILARKLELAERFRSGKEATYLPSSKRQTPLYKEFLELEVPDFYALDLFLFLDRDRGSGWVAYFRSPFKTVDGTKYGIISPRTDYLKVMATQAQIVALFNPGPSPFDTQANPYAY